MRPYQLENVENGLLILVSTGMRWFKEALPESWMDLQEALSRKQQKEDCMWLNFREYSSMAAECGVEGALFRTATRFLHETGKIRYFGDVAKAQTATAAQFKNDHLMGTVFISPEWMIGTLKGVMRHSHEAVKPPTSDPFASLLLTSF